MCIDDTSFWLIQRCRLKPTKVPTGVDDLLDYDYMGSSEFEFGALGDSLRVIIKNLPTYQTVKTAHTAVDGRRLCCFVPEGLKATVLNFLTLEAKEPQPLQERTYLRDSLNKASTHYSIDVWWDIGNHWIAYLGEKNGERLKAAIQVTATKWANKGK